MDSTMQNQIQPTQDPSTTTPPVNNPASQQQQQFQRLKVEDALTYLDQVKLQFGNQPQVYNDFLDIMKEFKSQSIDTPGVINRVSTLFRGHPDLIVGFNTFLPPGYKIEADNHTISVHQPGQQVVSMPHGQGGLPTSTPQTTISHRPNPPLQATVNTQPAPTGITSSTTPPGSQTSQQPVEFNHAINYVNKIKNRFHGQPEVYKSFLEILHTYQKEQKCVKDASQVSSTGGNTKPLTEGEVYSQVAALFQNQEDLLTEFGQFLPDANGAAGQYGTLSSLQGVSSDALGGLRNEHNITTRKPIATTYSTTKPKTSQPVRRPLAQLTQPAPKKAKYSSSVSGGSVSLSEAGKHGTLSEFAFFDRIRKAIKLPENYDAFLRCLVLFNQEVVTRSELVQLVSQFFDKHPDLFKWFKNFLGFKDDGRTSLVSGVSVSPSDGIPRINSDLAMEIDFNTCKKHGASYRALPASVQLPKCSGRNSLCHEVLNNTYVSFPTWSEDSTFVTSRKSQYEENIYRCEDERFELDMIIDLNNDALKVFEFVQRKIMRMSQEECSKFHLDDSLGGSSEVLYRKVVERIYGDKAGDIIEGLKKNPVLSVPIVIRRLKQKQEEWREMQKCFQKTWRETNEKFYLKSLDHQCGNFKATDLKNIRSKTLLHQIENQFDNRQEYIAKREKEELTPEEEEKAKDGPHIVLTYSSMQTVQDANALLIYHAKRQTGITNKEKKKIKCLLLKTFAHVMYEKEGSLSDDEEEKDQCDDEDDDKEEDISVPIRPNESHYTMMIVNNYWYVLFRLHNLLAERLCKMKKIAKQMEEYEKTHGGDRKESAAVALRLKAPKSTDPGKFYENLIDLVHQLLDGNIESSMYEDELREMFHTQAYWAFTLDKMVQNGVKQLTHVVNDEKSISITKLWKEQCKLGIGMGKTSSRNERTEQEASYIKKAEQILSEENVFKIIYESSPVEPKLSIELLDTDSDSSSNAPSTEQERDRWAAYVEKYVSDTELQKSVAERFKDYPVFLRRNINSYRKAALEEQNQELDEVEMFDNTECKFNIKSKKIRFVSQSGLSYYKQKCLARAKELHRHVSQAKWKKLATVLQRFSKKHVTEADTKRILNWFEDGSQVVEFNNDNEEPYHFYRKYKSPEK